MDYTWKVHNDPCSSNNFPMIEEITEPIHDNNRPPCWEKNKTDWQQLKTYAIEDWFKTQTAQF